MHQHAAQSYMGITPKVSQEVKSKHRRAQHAKVAIPALFKKKRFILNNVLHK